MSLTKYQNIKQLLHPGSYSDIKKWLQKEKASLSDKDLDNLILDSIIQTTSNNGEEDSEKALKIFNIKLKQHIKKSKE